MDVRENDSAATKAAVDIMQHGDERFAARAAAVAKYLNGTVYNTPDLTVALMALITGEWQSHSDAIVMAAVSSLAWVGVDTENQYYFDALVDLLVREGNVINAVRGALINFGSDAIPALMLGTEAKRGRVRHHAVHCIVAMFAGNVNGADEALLKLVDSKHDDVRGTVIDALATHYETQDEEAYDEYAD